MSRRGVALSVAAFAVVLALRVATLAPDPWEWDEVLFTNAVRDGIDIRVNRPHPPGYPLFVEASRVLTRFGVEPFRAATLVGATGSLLAVAGTSALLLAVGAAPWAAVLAGLLYAFIPAVWLHGVRPLSDGPAAAGFLFAAAALLVAVDSPRRGTLLAAAVLVAVTAGLRPQTGIALLPLSAVAAYAVAKRPRGWQEVLAALAAGAAVTAIVWAPAVSGSGGLLAFRDRVADQARYVAREDVVSVAEWVSWPCLRRWFRDPFGATELYWIFLGLCAWGVVRARRQSLRLVLLFAPLVFLTLAGGHFNVAPRYATVFLPLPCLLAALAFEDAGRRWPGVSAAVSAALVLGMAAVAARPAFHVAGRSSPPVAAMLALGKDPELAGMPLIFQDNLGVHVEAYLAGRKARPHGGDTPFVVTPGEVVVLADDGYFGTRPTRTFTFDDPLLRRISRGRYLSVTLTRPDPRVGALAVTSVDNPEKVDPATWAFTTRPGTRFTVAGLTPVEVNAVARSVGAGGAPGSVVVETTRGPEEVALEGGESRAVRFAARPGPDKQLFALLGVAGAVELSSWDVRRLPEPAAGAPSR